MLFHDCKNEIKIKRSDEPMHDKTYNLVCVPSEDSGQSVYQLSLTSPLFTFYGELRNQ